MRVNLGDSAPPSESFNEDAVEVSPWLGLPLVVNGGAGADEFELFWSHALETEGACICTRTIFHGGGGPDSSYNADKAFGGGGHDSLWALYHPRGTLQSGGDKRDLILATHNKGDVVRGGDGSDIIDTKDHHVDDVNGGAGKDSGRFDGKDHVTNVP